jgi:hypothetical protein
MTVSGLTFQPVGADDEAGLRTWFELRGAVKAADRPDDPGHSWALHTALLRHQWPGEDLQVFLARSGDLPVG